MSEHDTLQGLETRVEALDERLASLDRRVAGAELNAWEARIEQLRLEMALGRMEVRDEFAPRIERLRRAYDAASTELGEILALVKGAFDEASVDLGPALQQVEKAYAEARKAIG